MQKISELGYDGRYKNKVTTFFSKSPDNEKKPKTPKIKAGKDQENQNESGNSLSLAHSIHSCRLIEQTR